MAEDSRSRSRRDIRVIEYSMMSHERYVPATFASSLLTRVFVYPPLLVKTRLQIQSSNSVYSGTFDAFRRVIKYEGLGGLYRGFWISSLSVGPFAVQLTTYEQTRHFMTSCMGVTNNTVKLATAGFMGSFACQVLLVPIELVMQHMMLVGHAPSPTTPTESPTTKTNTTNTQATTTKTEKIINSNRPVKVNSSSPSLARHRLSPEDRRSRFGPLRAVIKGMYSKAGLRGFYQGFWSAIFCHCPHHALFWVFYDRTSDWLTRNLPDRTSRLAIVSLSAPLCGMMAAFLTNPLDVVRARIQVNGRPLGESFSYLWREERWNFLTKGASARVVFLGVLHFFTFVGYEAVKRWSVLDEFKHSVRW